DSEQRLRLITDAMPALIAYVDRERRYRFTNRAYEDWFGRPRSEINGKTMAEALAPDLYEKRRAFVDLALRGEFVTFEMRLPTGKSSIEYAHATYVPHFDEDGRVLGFFALIQDATERKRAARNLQEAKENLERRVEERTAALLDLNEALRRAKGEAENANLSKTKFLAAASHDLLQPLNAARVFAGALAERDLPDKEQRILGHLTTSLEAVDDLLSSLLEISRLEAGVLHPEFRDFAVGPLLQSLAAEHAPLAISKGLRFKVFSPPVYSHSDPKLVGRVLRNFLSNALRYTDQGGILLGCRRQKDSLIIGVWDTGQGIPEDKLTEIFEEFRRLKADRGGMTDNGVGLGLAIVERIAQGLDQDLKVRSKLGKGSFFGLRLPIIDSPDIPEPSPQPAPPRSSAVQGSNILVLDNETTIVAGMRVLLEGWGCQVVTATSLQAIEIYCKNTATPPDLVIADYHLDEGQIGLQALEILETRWGAGTVPSLIVTADHTPEVAQDVAARGAELMTKPVRPARLRAMLAHLLAKQT
ncbi:MAG: NahK/ErcS family hybrid sensor histidine kinase/response regulator, partial [Rhodospirillaceae bacterium]